MKLSQLSLVSLAAAASATSVRYDTGYDLASRSLNDVACSNGPNGLTTKYPQYSTQGDLPAFPRIGASSTIAGWNSPNCGSCFNVTYGTNSLYFLALDATRVDGLVMSQLALDQLTNGHAVEFGVVDARVEPVSVDHCFRK